MLFSSELQRRERMYEEKYRVVFKKRNLSQEHSLFIHAKPPRIMLVFPRMPACDTDTYYIRFKWGERFDRPHDVMWLLGSETCNAVGECTFYRFGGNTIFARLALLSLLVRLPEGQDVFTQYSSSWGGGFQLQCVGCGKAYATVFGWSHVSVPFQAELPKTVCPSCHP